MAVDSAALRLDQKEVVKHPWLEEAYAGMFLLPFPQLPLDVMYTCFDVEVSLGLNTTRQEITQESLVPLLLPPLARLVVDYARTAVCFTPQLHVAQSHMSVAGRQIDIPCQQYAEEEHEGWTLHQWSAGLPCHAVTSSARCVLARKDGWRRVLHPNTRFCIPDARKNTGALFLWAAEPQKVRLQCEWLNVLRYNTLSFATVRYASHAQKWQAVAPQLAPQEEEEEEDATFEIVRKPVTLLQWDVSLPDRVEVELNCRAEDVCEVCFTCGDSTTLCMSGSALFAHLRLTGTLRTCSFATEPGRSRTVQAALSYASWIQLQAAVVLLWKACTVLRSTLLLRNSTSNTHRTRYHL